MARRIISVLLAILTACVAPAAALPQSQQNLLIIILDDVGKGDIFPAVATPNIQAFAVQGMSFSRAYSFPVCSPTRCAVLLGEYPRRHGIGDVINAHKPDQSNSPPPSRIPVSLAEALEPTHQTAFFGKWHLGRLNVAGAPALESGPFGSGFEHWFAGSPNSIGQGTGTTGYFRWWRVEEGLSSVSGVYATDAQRDAFVAWWSGTAGPKFAMLAFNAAHAPYDAPPGVALKAAIRDQFTDIIQNVDAAIGACLSVVSLSDAYVILLGDNGTPDEARPITSTSGFWKGTTYEGGVRVPMIVAGPGIAPGASGRLVSVLDVPTTALELLGKAPRGFQDSQSFANALGSWQGTAARSWVFAERYGAPGLPDEQAVIEATWKLRVWDPDGPGPLPPHEAVYNLGSDPFEQTPIDPAAVTIASARLHSELGSLPSR